MAATGIADRYYLKLNQPAHNDRLWLLVNNTWVHLDNPSAGQQAAVQNAFNAGSNLEVFVTYDNATKAIGALAVRSCSGALAHRDPCYPHRDPCYPHRDPCR
jgi:hypothetical protein